MLDSSLRELHAHGIRPHVTGHRPGTPPWTQATFTLGHVAVRLFDHHMPAHTTVEMHQLPVRHVPAALNAVGVTPDPGLLPFPGLPEDYEGEAARWLAGQMGDAIGMVSKWPVPGTENDADPAWYTRELSTCWSGSAWALVELAAPSMDAPCILRIHQLTDIEAHAVITAIVRTTTPKTPQTSTGPAQVPPRTAAEVRSAPGPR
ncbi:hypothetical protein ACIBCM_32255 [Streptomyces sp. NPDC051018]|uniref:hypothetical protein n=1 Tax=Streptomyces sp. NPDC051018 TaxID=3365639 RepID=UPI0037BA728C